MARPPRKLGLLLVAYLAVLGYALVAWLPQGIDLYQRLSEKHPQLSLLYLAGVSAGGLILGGLSLWLLVRVWRNTRVKQRRDARREKNPSQMSATEKRTELAENLRSSQQFAAGAQVAPALRGEIQHSLDQLTAKQTERRLEIVAFGTISSGKSTLLNALAGRPVCAADVVGGTTSEQITIPWPGQDQVVLVDTPGLAEVRGEHRAASAATAAKHADLVLLVVDGPLKAYEVELVQQLLRMEKRLVVCLNKADWYEPEEQQQLTAQIVGQLPQLDAADVVAVRAAPVRHTRVYVDTDGREQQQTRELPADVQALATRLLQIVAHDGSELLLANLLLQSRGLVEEAKQQIRTTLDEQADKIIQQHMWAAGAAGATPLPLLDLAGGSAITVKLVLELARVYQQAITADTVVKMLEKLGQNLIAMVGVTAATPALVAGIGTLLKTVPGIGTLAGGLIQGTAQALVTRWIGNVFQKYFQAEMNVPVSGLAELAQAEWQRLTQPESLRALVRHGRRELTATHTVEDAS